jgi:dolichyl-phosphate beta-glucosyltransferase
MATQGISPFLSIIIPAYNEIHRLPKSLRIIHAFLHEIDWFDRTEVIVVDDGSQDQTVESVKDLKESWPQLAVIAMPHLGKGGAVKTGMLHATGEYIFFCDADLSMPINEIVKFVPPQGPDCDVIIGSREVKGAHRYNEPAYRHIMGRVFNTLVQVLILPGIKDTQCGFKCIRRAAAYTLAMEQTLEGMSFDVELLALARLHKYSIAEIPINWYHERSSRVRPVQDTLDMFREVIKMRRRLGYLRRHPPSVNSTAQQYARWIESQDSPFDEVTEKRPVQVDPARPNHLS